MAYELTIRTADDVASTELNNNVGSEVNAFNLILPERQSGFDLREQTFDRPAHNCGWFYISDKVDPTSVISNFKAVVANAGWVEIEGRHVWAEYRQDKYLNDETYYPYGAQNLLRSPPEINYIDGFEAEISEAHFLISGSEYNVTDKTLTFSEPSEYIRCDAVVADSSGNVSIVGGQECPEPKENGVEWPQLPQTANDEMVGAYVTVKESLNRIPRSGIDIVDVVGDDGDRTVDYSHGTVPDAISS